jgi:aspartate-semialdehyde dehydrogenase
VLEAASSYGRRGIETLHTESIALFNQHEPAEPEVFGRPVAFDCFPSSNDIDEDGQSERDAILMASVRKILGGNVALSASGVQVPSFLGNGTSLVVEFERAVDVKTAADALSTATGVDLWQEDGEAPSLRSASGRREVLVGRLRRDSSSENALALWMVADTPSLAAANAVDLAVARLRVN